MRGKGNMKWESPFGHTNLTIAPSKTIFRIFFPNFACNKKIDSIDLSTCNKNKGHHENIQLKRHFGITLQPLTKNFVI
jgi:hypothetical protein